MSLGPGSSLKNRTVALGVLVSLVFVLLVGQLFYLQVIRG